MIRGWSGAVSHHALPFCVTVRVGGGGFSVAGLVLLNSTSERENVRLFLHIFVVSLQPDEPAHVVALTLQQRQRVSARQAPGEALASCGP